MNKLTVIIVIATWLAPGNTDSDYEAPKEKIVGFFANKIRELVNANRNLHTDQISIPDISFDIKQPIGSAHIRLSNIRVGKLLEHVAINTHVMHSRVDHQFDNQRKSRIVIALNDNKLPFKFHAITNNLGFKVEHDFKGQTDLSWFNLVIVYDKQAKSVELMPVEPNVSINRIKVNRQPPSVADLARNKWIRRIAGNLAEVMEKPLSDYYHRVLTEELKQWEADIVRLMTEPTFENDSTSIKDSDSDFSNDWD